MKRSDVNRILMESDAFIRANGQILPPFANWSPDEMKSRRGDIAGILDRRLGWDITDYGRGDFARRGLVLFTARNGDAADLRKGRGVLYAEKVMISRVDQVAPMHRHNVKAEDIINRAGGILALKLFASGPDGLIDRGQDVTVPTYGILRTLPAGGILRLHPGESVTLLPGVWHAFWGEEADVLIGEVSTVNDDLTDNVFAEPIARFSEIEEDEAPVRLLVSDYDRWLA